MAGGDGGLVGNPFLMRHGQSEANVQGRIVGDPVSGVDRFGLTEYGATQVRESLGRCRGRLGSVSLIVASDFLRTRQTAEIAAESLGVPLEFDVKLRERGFGDWEGTGNENYQRVWDRDGVDPTHHQWGVESVTDVAERMTVLLQELARRGPLERVLIVSHGDPLQIVQSVANGGDLRRHREGQPIETAEIRRLRLPQEES